MTLLLFMSLFFEVGGRLVCAANLQGLLRHNLFAQNGVNIE